MEKKSRRLKTSVGRWLLDYGSEQALYDVEVLLLVKGMENVVREIEGKTTHRPVPGKKTQ